MAFQRLETFAAKQLKHWRIGDRHFLGLAQGLALPQLEGHNRNSVIFEWDGERFVEFQVDPVALGLQLAPLRDRRDALRRARRPPRTDSVLYRWDGARLRRPPGAAAEGRPGLRALRRRHTTWSWPAWPSRRAVLRWDGERFDAHAELEGLGARELAVEQRAAIPDPGQLHPRHAGRPEPSLTSQVYAWRRRRLSLTVAEFPTVGGTDVEVLAARRHRVRGLQLADAPTCASPPRPSSTRCDRRDVMTATSTSRRRSSELFSPTRLAGQHRRALRGRRPPSAQHAVTR